jgi:hypothetical protein
MMMISQPRAIWSPVKWIAALTLFVTCCLSQSSMLAQDTSPAAPEPNILLVYDSVSVSIVNISNAPVSLDGLSFWRLQGKVKYDAVQLGRSLAPAHCVQLRTNQAGRNDKPAECDKRDRWVATKRSEFLFWIGTQPDAVFRPRLNGNTLTICGLVAKRCTFYLPQGDAATKPLTVLDPTSNQPMTPGIQVAYDADQMWIGNFTPGTILPTQTLQLQYPVKGVNTVWTPADGPWDGGTTWDNRPLAAGECIVLYRDPAKVTPLLPCTPVGQALRDDQPWLLKFDIAGPREDRWATCGGDKPPAGPALCLVGG